MKEIELYLGTAESAHKAGEIDRYRESFKANVACKEAIQEAIHSHYANNRLDPACVKEVTDQFGFQRVLFVLANTVSHKSWDARFSKANKNWASQYDLPNDPDLFGYGNRRIRYVVDGVNSGLTDLFLTQARRQYQDSLHK